MFLKTRNMQKYALTFYFLLNYFYYIKQIYSLLHYNSTQIIMQMQCLEP